MILSALSPELLQFIATSSGYITLAVCIRVHVPPPPDSAALLVHIFSCLLSIVLRFPVSCVLVPDATSPYNSSGPCICPPLRVELSLVVVVIQPRESL